MQHVAGIQPNTFSYSALISACGRAGRWQQAEMLFHELQQKAQHDPNAAPNTVTYSALISGGWCSGGAGAVGGVSQPAVRGAGAAPAGHWAGAVGAL